MTSNIVALDLPARDEPSKAAQFRSLLASPQLEFIMEAHNGLSAKIVEEAGFKGIWASGLSISTALGVRDRNEASWTQVTDVLEFMSDATSIPIMLDGDTGYGDFNNFRRLVKKLCQREIAAVCIEDKVFPKTNSLIDGDQTLADVDEFCGKIKAGKDSQSDEDFSVIARVEALIAGWGMDEALRRAEAYHRAGADGILIHSRKSSAEEILAFAKVWANRGPLVIVPTAYYATPTEQFRNAKVSMVIWANHNLRASLDAMREVSGRIHREESLIGIEGKVAKLKDVFGIVGNSELVEAERKYLGPERRDVKAVVLAATRGSALERLTRDKPKCMVDLRGDPLLRHMTRGFNEAGIRDVTVVCGYKPDAVDLQNITKVVNPDYETSGEVHSLAQVADRLVGDCVISYGDIVFQDHLLSQLLESRADIAILVDTYWRQRRDGLHKSSADLVVCSEAYRPDQFLEAETITVQEMGAGVAAERAQGEWVGLARVSEAGAALLRAAMAEMAADGSAVEAGLPELLNRLIQQGHRVEAVYVTGNWLDINDVFDLARARNEF